MNMLNTLNDRVLHVRLDGRSFDVNLSTLDVSSRSTDREVRAALARHLDLTERALVDHVIDRHPNGNLTLRPQAVFG